MVEHGKCTNKVSTMVILRKKCLALLERVWTNVSLSVLRQYLIEKDVITLSKLAWFGVYLRAKKNMSLYVLVSKTREP